MQNAISLELLAPTRQQAFLDRAEKWRVLRSLAAAQPRPRWSVRFESLRASIRSGSVFGWRSRKQQAVCACTDTTHSCCAS